MVSRYASKAPGDAQYETHRDYIDIQLVVSGKETVEARTVEGLSVSVPYKPDIEFYLPSRSRGPATIPFVSRHGACVLPRRRPPSRSCKGSGSRNPYTRWS
ncbi:MAG: YhcH/YjgK/YiaL family protein [Candidatus Moduliflexus flocculans]|nr:YhcH/YjgK/YiaL family protein [Candidatus Moduliflexus flocculans]